MTLDFATLEAHRAWWGVEEQPLRSDLQRLTPEERSLYEDLRNDRVRKGLRRRD